MTGLKIAVIPNDPLTAYVAKGEVKENYFNPLEMFDEVHVISLADSEAPVEEVDRMAGRARMVIHPVGRPKPWELARHAKQVVDLARTLKPDLIRGYNPLLMGHLAVKVGIELGIPSVISVHDDFSYLRNLRLYGLEYGRSARGLYQVIHRLFHLRSMFDRVDGIICAYPFAARWVEKYAPGRATIIINRVDLSRFKPRAGSGLIKGRPKVINIGRQFQGKNPSNLIRAAAGMEIELTIVGHGPYHPRLVKLVRELGIDDRVRLIRSVAHRELPALMAENHIFAMNLRQPGICIPVLEAFAAGLPVVINEPFFKAGLDLVDEAVVMVPDSAEGYAQGLKRLISDPDLREAMIGKAARMVRRIGAEATEAKERELYLSLLANAASGSS